MKKLITLLAVFLMGTASVFAQDAYEVYVSWNYETPYYCLSQLSSDYQFEVTLTIYDDVNNVTVADETNIVDWDDIETTFSATQTGVENHCENATSTPNLVTSVLVEMVHKSTQAVYCFKGDSDDFTCGQFSNGISFPLTFN